jgi:hypothetical protein
MQFSTYLKIWFPALEDTFAQDDLDDAFESHVFELKNLFCTSIALQKLFDAKIIRFSKIITAYNSFSVQKIELNLIEQNNDVTAFSDIILTALDFYFVKRSEISLAIRNEQRVDFLFDLARQLANLEKDFSSKWMSNYGASEDVIMSKIPDPMEIRNAILKQQKDGIFTFVDLSKKKTHTDIIIKNELYRRILISNYGK